MKKLLVILGPTSTGKTDLALDLAKKFNGELVSCDSRQVYTGLDIGTGKLPNEKFKVESAKLKKEKGYWIIDGIRIWMYDVADPKEQYNVAEYAKAVSSVIDNIETRRKLPIIVGGTGLYLKAILEGLPNLSVTVDQILRKQLEKLSKAQLQEKLRDVNANKWKNLNESDRENPRRLVRAIELSMSNHEADLSSDPRTAFHEDILKIGLTATRKILYKRSDERVVSRINQGMVEEARKLQEKGLTLQRMKQLGLEYGVLANYLEGRANSKELLIKQLQEKIHGYIRRQLTWFNKEKEVNWFDITRKNFSVDVEKMIGKWYHRTNVA